MAELIGGGAGGRPAWSMRLATVLLNKCVVAQS
jgi:hypothetical protein